MNGSAYVNFHWQRGYGIFSISTAHRPTLEVYIANQAEHHRLVTFQDEYRGLLMKYGIEFDDRYMWD
jgi:uncharacterized protein YbgA (DUF1722 family)